MGKECRTCNSFDAYFTKGYCCYLRTDYGYCRYYQKIKLKHSPACEKHNGKTYNIKVRYNEVMRGMANVITNIEMLKDYLENNKK